MPGSSAETLLKELIRRRHWEYGKFAAEYEKATAQSGEHRWAPSRAQYYRWTSGQLKRGMPYPGACRTLEAMFTPWTASELFGPPPARAEARLHGNSDQEWNPSAWAAFLSSAAAGFRVAAAAQVTGARSALGLSLGEFAGRLRPVIGWLPGAGEVGAWECGATVPPGDVVLFAQACLAGAR
jgi:hypothetical protein